MQDSTLFELDDSQSCPLVLRMNMRPLTCSSHVESSLPESCSRDNRTASYLPWYFDANVRYPLVTFMELWQSVSLPGPRIGTSDEHADTPLCR